MRPPDTSARRLALALAPLAMALLLTAVFVATRWPLWESALFSDQSPAAWLSSAQLLGAAFLAGRLGLERALPGALAAWLTLTLGGLALDEQFMLHEAWKYRCADWLDACAQGWVRELPMLLVAVLGALTLLALARTFDDRLCRRLIALSLTVGLLALGIDLAEGPATVAPFEELIEVAAEALFIGALLAAPSARQ